MSDSGVLIWANAQPVWVQVVIGLFVFFILFPFVMISLIKVAQACSSSSSSTALEIDSRSRQQCLPADDDVSNETLAKALCSLYPDKTEDQIAAYLQTTLAAEKSALKKNPKVQEAIKRVSVGQLSGADD